MNLFELNRKVEELKEMDLDPEVMKDTLDSLELSRDEKLDNLANWYDDNAHDIAWLTDKIKSFQQEKKRLTNQNKSIMKYITDSIDDAGYKQLKTANHILRPRNYRESTVIDNEALVPDSYKTIETVEKIDRTALYKDLKAGTEIAGAHLEPNRKTKII